MCFSILVDGCLPMRRPGDVTGNESIPCHIGSGRPALDPYAPFAPIRLGAMPGDTQRILVIGAGISGSAAALALSKAGFPVTVSEAHPHAAADIGAFLTLASNGMLALGQLDAATSVRDIGFPLTQLRLLDETGAEVATTDLGEYRDPLAQFRCLRWSELSAALQAQVRGRGIPLRHGSRLVDAAEDARGVTARFADGTSAVADLLIGADGLNSTVRPLIDARAAQPRYAGQRVFYGY